MTKPEQINLSNALNFLASSIDDLKTVWIDYLNKEYSDTDDLADRSFFEDMHIVSAYVIANYKQGKTEKFESFFNAVEEIFTERDLTTCSCISAGLIEGIQAYQDIDHYTEFDKWLKPKTKKWWDQALDYWRRR